MRELHFPSDTHRQIVLIHSKRPAPAKTKTTTNNKKRKGRGGFAVSPRKNTSPRVLVKHGGPHECCMAVSAVFTPAWFLCLRLWRRQPTIQRATVEEPAVTCEGDDTNRHVRRAQTPPGREEILSCWILSPSAGLHFFFLNVCLKQRHFHTRPIRGRAAATLAPRPTVPAA